MPASVKLPYPFIHGLTKRQQQEIWRDFQALAGQLATGSTAGALPNAVRIVVVGRSGSLSTSSDGVNFTVRTSSFGTSDIHSACWSPQLRIFVAVGAAGKIATSPSGVIWTQQSSPTSTKLNFVRWSAELGLFVAVGNTGVIVTSTDGETWTLQSSAWSTNNATGLAWSADAGLWVASVGFGGIYSSTDGVNWTNRTSPFTHATQGVAWNAALGLFHMAAGSAGVSEQGYSTDGINWSTWGTSPSDNSVGPAGFETSEVPFIATGGQSSTLDTSPDGTTWTGQTVGSIDIFTGLDRSDALDLFIAVGYNFGASSGYVYTSTTGTSSWTSRSFGGFIPEGVCAAKID